MAQQRTGSASAANSRLSTLFNALNQAKLTSVLDNAEAVTVFAPVNEAFAQLPQADLNRLLADPAQLKKVLTYHTVNGRIAPEKLAGTHPTLEGQKITVTGSGGDFKVNNSAVIICGNIQTRNGVVYLVDRVLMPPS
ncbi:fasciclin domain-containing protein [Catellatospora sp. TT07R-123]|uniref:fasciclin domain-containing protein n=1 Tax=Catellatospora sp. TT07R-123 TaxID=2733863 RepID=UPI001BB3E624|nr:fasciclin domain-containing protein [Catellatospora sp. TT07R-123]